MSELVEIKILISIQTNQIDKSNWIDKHLINNKISIIQNAIQTIEFQTIKQFSTNWHSNIPALVISGE